MSGMLQYEYKCPLFCSTKELESFNEFNLTNFAPHYQRESLWWRKHFDRQNSTWFWPVVFTSVKLHENLKSHLFGGYGAVSNQEGGLSQFKHNEMSLPQSCNKQHFFTAFTFICRCTASCNKIKIAALHPVLGSIGDTVVGAISAIFFLSLKVVVVVVVLVGLQHLVDTIDYINDINS